MIVVAAAVREEMLLCYLQRTQLMTVVVAEDFADEEKHREVKILSEKVLIQECKQFWCCRCSSRSSYYSHRQMK